MSAATGRWLLERAVGSAADFHARPLPDPLVPAVWLHEVDRPALVLGSAQRLDTVDVDAVEQAGIELVRRHSGGGAVLLVPGEALWIDVLVPAGDPLWDDDVGRAFVWLGHVWVEALLACGLDGLTVHTGPMMRTPWSDRICFAGLGAGEVTRAGAKVVGLSSRRTRAGARFQGVALARFDAAALAGLLAPPHPTPSEIAALDASVGTVDVPLAALAAAFLGALARR